MFNWTFNFNPSRQFDIVSIARSGILGIGGKQIGDSLGRSQSKANAAAQPISTTTPNTTVDPDGAVSPSDKTAARVGRAALIQTSSEGVLGTSPTGRRKLLGN